MKQPQDKQRTKYLELHEDLERHLKLARNHGMKPGNAWLAHNEISKASQLMSDLETLLDEIKESDNEEK